ncbi:MAG: rhodanese-like domain-containing protein [Alphaproteobacteria bacterium]|nr:rhodanese-like domain-containing protein [Alphaproteobacteria bacterium]
MIRDRVKRALKKVAVKALNMEFDVEDRDPASKTVGTVGEIDESVIPKLVDGDGDTPGPKHMEDIGRTWVAAQVLSGSPLVFVDIRPPAEVVAGVLPGAILAPGESILDHTDLLPDQTTRVTIYDQTGQLGSAELAEKLRAAGWGWARRLKGGYAEWIEHGEQTELPRAPAGAAHKPGEPVKLADGRQGHVLRILDAGRYVVWIEGEGEVGPLDADALST